MDDGFRDEMLWAAGCFFGALAFLYALVLAASAGGVPTYALVTGAALMAIAIDGYRFYQENAEIDRDVRATGAWRPSRLIPARERAQRSHAQQRHMRQRAGQE